MSLKARIDQRKRDQPAAEPVALPKPTPDPGYLSSKLFPWAKRPDEQPKTAFDEAEEER